jgi:hypothetical protein
MQPTFLCFMGKKIYGIAALIVFAALCLAGKAYAAEPEEAQPEGMVTCANGRLSINAKDVKPDELMKELGEKCGIKIVVFGEAFSDAPVSMQFQKLPLRQGLQRVLRMLNVSNHLIHSEPGDNGSRITEIDLVGKKGGEKQLSAGAAARSRSRDAGPAPAEQSKDSKEKRKQAIKGQIPPEVDKKIQENFLNMMDEMLKTQMESGKEPDPAEVMKMFKDVIPPEMRDQIPPEVLEELERAQ